MNNNLKEKQKQLVENRKSYQYYSIATLEDEGYDIKNLPIP